MPSPYKETTYHEVTRWTEETEIKYAPTGKRPGTKSADRYAGYAVAKTVGEALRLGSKPEDLLNDFEKGLLTMTGGPKRESPLDLMAIEDASDLTEVDLLLARWGYHEGPRANAEDDGEGDAEDDVRRNRTGYKGLRCEHLSGRVAQQYAKLRKVVVAKKHGIRRSKANIEAGRILEAARQEGRKVQDEEVLRVLRMWEFRRYADRPTVVPEEQEEDFVFNDAMGLLRARDGRFAPTVATKEYPQVTQLFCQIFKENRPEGVEIDWPFTSISVNSSYAAKRHRETTVFSLGPSAIRTFGEFTGGRLQYWPDDDGKSKVSTLPESDKVSLDARGKTVVFDGRRCHAVEPYDGEEFFSLVFFMLEGYEKTPEDVRKQLAEAGISFPNEESQKFVTNLLPAPKQLQRSNAQNGKYKPRMLAHRRGDRSGSPSVKPEASTPVKMIRRKTPSAQPKSSVKQAEQEKRRRREPTARVEPEPSTKRAKVTPRSSAAVKQEATEGDETPLMTDCIPLQVGMVCTLTGFRPTEGLNGKEVVCKRYDPKSDRWIVSADWLNGAIKRVISENLVPTDDPVALQPQEELHGVQEQTASQIREGDEVVVVADFDALGHDSVRLKLGDKGTVDEIDMDGDACISFERFDDMQWVGSADFCHLKVLLPAETSRPSSTLERRTPTSSSLQDARQSSLNSAQGAASTAQMRDDQMRYEKCADESTEDFAARLRGCLMKRDIEVRQLRAQMAAAVAALQPQRMDIGAEVS